MRVRRANGLVTAALHDQHESPSRPLDKPRDIRIRPAPVDLDGTLRTTANQRIKSPARRLNSAVSRQKRWPIGCQIRQICLHTAPVHGQGHGQTRCCRQLRAPRTAPGGLGRHDRRLVSGISRRSPCEQEDLSAINRFPSELLTRPKPATRIVASADPRADAGARSTTRPGRGRPTR